MTIDDYRNRFPDSPVTLAHLSQAFGTQEALYDAFFAGELDQELSDHIRRHTSFEYLANRATIRAMGKLANTMDSLKAFLEKRNV